MCAAFGDKLRCGTLFCELFRQNREKSLIMTIVYDKIYTILKVIALKEDSNKKTGRRKNDHNNR